MSNDLDILKQELSIAKQEKEILELRMELQKTQAQKASRLEDSLFSPDLYNHYQNVAKMLSKTSIIPIAYRDKEGDIFVAMAMGYQLGLPVEQSLQDIAVINGRPCLWGDGLLAVCLNYPDCESIDEKPIYAEGKDIIIGYSCTAKRKGHSAHTQTFMMQDAERAGLTKKQGPWQAYPNRMLQLRARSLALRDKFADALRGLRIAEIEQDDSSVIEAQVVRVEETQTQRLKSAISKSIKDDSAIDNEPVEAVTSTVQDEKITQIMADQIDITMDDKGFSEERKKKALEYFKVKSLEELTLSQAELFISQLNKA